MTDASPPEGLQILAPPTIEPSSGPTNINFTPVDGLVSQLPADTRHVARLASEAHVADAAALADVRQEIESSTTPYPLSPEQIQASLPVFLKTVYNVNFKDLHPDTVQAITTLIDKQDISQQELDAGIADIMSSVKNDLSQKGKLTEDELRRFDGLDSAIRQGIIKPTQLFEQARDLIPSLESLSPEQRAMVEGLKEEMGEVGDDPEKERVKKLALKTAKVGKVLGIGGMVMFGLMVWRAFGEE